LSQAVFLEHPLKLDAPNPPADATAISLQTNQIELSAQVLRQFRVVFGAVRRHFHKIEKQAGIGGANIWTLSLIADHPGIGVSQLAKYMDVHQSTASNLVRTLNKAGLVQINKSAQDKRHVEIFPLPDGLKILDKVPKPYSGVLPAALAELDTPSLLRMTNDLNKLIQRLDVDESAAQTPLSML
jgi:DNA-binding MarR family transcriptional regulator